MAGNYDAKLGTDIQIKDVVAILSKSSVWGQQYRNIFKLLIGLNTQHFSKRQNYANPKEELEFLITDWVHYNKKSATLSRLICILQEAQCKDLSYALLREFANGKSLIPLMMRSPRDLHRCLGVLTPFLWLHVILFVLCFIALCIPLSISRQLFMGHNHNPEDNFLLPLDFNSTEQVTVPEIIQKLSPKPAPNNNVHIYGYGTFASNSLHAENIHMLEAFTWQGCIEPVELFQVLKSASYLSRIELVSTNCDKTFQGVKHPRKAISSKINTPVSLPNLTALSLKGVPPKQGFLEMFRRTVVMGGLEDLKIEGTTMRIEDADELRELLVHNRNIKKLMFMQTQWEVWLLRLELPILEMVTDIIIDYPNHGSTRTEEVGRNFCKQFPNLESFNMTSDLPYNEVNNIVKCKNLKRLSLNLFVPKNVKTVSMAFVEFAAPTLQKLNIYFHFETNYVSDCHVTGVKAARQKLSFATIQSNCNNLS